MLVLRTEQGCDLRPIRRQQVKISRDELYLPWDFIEMGIIRSLCCFRVDKIKTHHQSQVLLAAVKTGGFHCSLSGSILLFPLIFSFSFCFSLASSTAFVSTITCCPFYLVVSKSSPRLPPFPLAFFSHRHKRIGANVPSTAAYSYSAAYAIRLPLSLRSPPLYPPH